MVKRIVIMRGVSGAGKSTYVKTHFPGAVICSSDNFWSQLDPKKTYQENFDIKRLGEAHAWNLRNYTLLVVGDYARHSEVNVVVDNTNTSIAELAPYYALAQAFGIPVEIITLDTDPAVALARNTHGVPEGAHKAQVERLRRANKEIPPYWKHTIVTGNVDV